MKYTEEHEWLRPEGDEIVVGITHEGAVDADDLLENIGQRMSNERSVERKVCVDELAKITRTRIERMLGPEDGYPEY